MDHHAGQDRHITYIGETDFRRDRRLFGIKQADRFSHLYVIGKTGTGKSTLLETLIGQDIEAGCGVILLDPHGDLASRLATRYATARPDSLIYFDVPDRTQPYGYNPLQHVGLDRIALVASGLLEVLRKQWPDAWGLRMEHILRNAVYTLLEQPKSTIADILRLLTDASFRTAALARVRNEAVRTYWTEEYARYSPKLRADAIMPIQNKIGAFLADPLLNRIFTAPPQPLRLRRIMDRGDVLLVNLSKGALGEDTASVLGGLLVTAVSLAAFSRSELPEAERRPCFLYLDEFQTFTTRSIATLAAELRKYRVGVTFAHQFLGQLDDETRLAVLGNIGTLISFRLGPADAVEIARELSPKFDATDLLNLANRHVYLKLMIDGAVSQPFSATTLPPAELADRCRHSDGK